MANKFVERRHGEAEPEKIGHVSREEMKRVAERRAEEEEKERKKAEERREEESDAHRREMSGLDDLEQQADDIKKEILTLEILLDPHSHSRQIGRTEDEIAEIIELRGKHEAAKAEYDKKSWFGKLVSGKPVNYRVNAEYLQQSERELERAKKELEILQNPASRKDAQRRLKELREQQGLIQIQLGAQRRKLGFVKE